MAAPHFHKVQETNKLLLRTMILILFSTAILSVIGVPRSNPTQDASQPLVLEQDTAEIQSICTLTDVICPGENAATKPQTGSRTTRPLVVSEKGSIIVPSHLMKIFKETCYEHNFKDSDCPKVLAGMAYTESKFDTKARGDWTKSNGYRSHGIFQIQTRLHGITVNQATDPAFASNWTLERLIRKGYPHYATASIIAHNGAGPMAERYAGKVKLAIKNIQ